MRMSWRDGLATLFVGIGAVLYALWLAGVELGALNEVKALGAVILGLGLAASVIAVVYGVGAGLLQASRIYLVVASLIGLAALVAGIAVLATANETWLATLMVATAVLWVMSTIRHAAIPIEGHGATDEASLPKAA